MRQFQTEPRFGEPSGIWDRAETNDPTGPRFVVEDVYPSVDGGRYPVKRLAGQPVEVWADVLREGHDQMAVALIWRRETDSVWNREPMAFDSNDRWRGRFTPPAPGRFLFAIEAWTDTFGTWRKELAAKRAAGQNITLELREGRALLSDALNGAPSHRTVIERACAEFDRTGISDPLLEEELARAMADLEPGDDVCRSASFPLTADREIAVAGAWYELFPRSPSPEPGRHGTFRDCIARVPDIAALGFDVIYVPPIHPIGRTNRKGRNNATTAQPGDPGSPYAIGAAEGGHDAVHPELGTLEDFRHFVTACRSHGMEVALDFAIQCSPDHPWLREHPEWFRWRSDGTIKYAENPPKRYEDIVNPDFYCADRIALWEALRDVVLFWVHQGVQIFRVDNPHTKPFPFWEWLIHDVQTREPRVIFLSEAFTRPKVMKLLAKLGFTQSYTYFTWRTHKAELQEYLSELTRYPEVEYYRPNFFMTTPDILPGQLQKGEVWMFKSRLALAATLSSNYGMLAGYELIEHEPIPGKEEYIHSEKYELKTRDWNKPGNIKDYVARLNRIRRTNPALLQTAKLRFAQVDSGDVIGFVKESHDGHNAVASAICLTGPEPRQFWFHFGEMEIGPPRARKPIRQIENLVTGERHALEWGGVRLTINPADDPAVLFRCLT
jgi:starch synthase (maltosyl-transferring)